MKIRMLVQVANVQLQPAEINVSAALAIKEWLKTARRFFQEEISLVITDDAGLAQRIGDEECGDVIVLITDQQEVKAPMNMTTLYNPASDKDVVRATLLALAQFSKRLVV